ncbi:hypothetical protein BCR37DRAFT_376596 [Protomyces lactucae-debilis]|uniref:Uncharacterized protein n=1 Tax=Protomyces lactucae-debilis TaxID=2754530 RepID=A0A1Y2FRZ6_PROLT|nr:uncharacterized protein BCR37DRAFT_376596 [Protomyces lactucae-debilis]ORY86074.1 hypothetical protein BCR37DRAFT_376596 [Protomyces lactucae-debilis]
MDIPQASPSPQSTPWTNYVRQKHTFWTFMRTIAVNYFLPLLVLMTALVASSYLSTYLPSSDLTKAVLELNKSIQKMTAIIARRA